MSEGAEVAVENYLWKKKVSSKIHVNSKFL